MQPDLAEIAAIKTTADVGREIVRLHAMGIPAPFGVASGSDNHNPNDVLAQIYASGLGLPDRDYYFKTEPRFVEARAKYVAYVQKLFELAGWSPGEGEDGRRNGLRDREEAGRGFARQGRAARSEGHRPQDHLGRPPENDSGLRLDGVREVGRVPAGRRQRQRAEVHGRSPEAPRLDARPRLEDVPDPAGPRRGGPVSLGAFRAGELRIPGRVSSRREGDETALEAVRGVDGPAARRSPGPEVRREVLPARGQGADAGDGPEPAARHEGDDRGARLDERRDEGQGPRETLDLQSQDRLSRQVEGLQPGPDLARGVPERRRRRPQVQRRGRPRADRQARGPRALRHDAADLQRLLQPFTQRDRVPRGNPAASGLQPRSQRRRELRSDRGGHRSRDQPRLRRPGCAVRRAGTSQELVDRRGPQEVSGEDAVRRRSVRPLRGRPRRLPERQAGHRRVGRRPGGGPDRLPGLSDRAEGQAALPTIDGFTPDQQFFIAWGQFRGDAVTPELARTMAQGDPHPIGKYRVIGSVSNLPEFAAAFGCKPGSAMVRPEAQRCDVW